MTGAERSIRMMGWPPFSWRQEPIGLGVSRCPRDLENERVRVVVDDERAAERSRERAA